MLLLPVLPLLLAEYPAHPALVLLALGLQEPLPVNLALWYLQLNFLKL